MGEARGRLEEARRILLRLAARRLGDAAQATHEKIAAIESVDRQEALTLRLLEVETWEDLLEENG